MSTIELQMEKGPVSKEIATDSEFKSYDFHDNFLHLVNFTNKILNRFTTIPNS